MFSTQAHCSLGKMLIWAWHKESTGGFPLLSQHTALFHTPRRIRAGCKKKKNLAYKG